MRVPAVLGRVWCALCELERATRPKEKSDTDGSPPITETGWLGIMALAGMAAGFVYALVTLP